MNLSRVIGPIIGAAIYYALSAAPVFAINAADLPVRGDRAALGEVPAAHERPGRRARASPGSCRASASPAATRCISHILLTLFSFSFFSLAFVGLMPVIAEESFDIGPKSWQYGVLYACFGLGAALGAVSVGHGVRPGLEGEAAAPGVPRVRGRARGVRACSASPALAYPVALLLGYAYFVAITALSTLIQSHLVDEERGRVMALWIMGFGGTVPVGVLVGGWVGHATSITAVILAGAVWAVVLAAWSNAQSLRAKGAPDV